MNNTNKKWRSRQHELARSEIRAAAWAVVRRAGAAGMTLRGIAAELGISAPALYRYYENRDALVTELILEAIGSFADAQAAAREACLSTRWRDRLRALGHGYRAWALENTEAFILIFGNPIPGYKVPIDLVMPAASRMLRPLIVVLEEAHAAGGLRLPVAPPASVRLARDLDGWNAVVHKTHRDILYLAITIAARVQGLVNLEIGRQLPPFFSDGGGLYDREIGRLVLELGTGRYQKRNDNEKGKHSG